MTQPAREPEVLLSPPADVLDTSRIGDYLRWLRAERGVEFAGDGPTATYDALWRWSVEDLSGFWRSVWDYFDVIAHEPPTRTVTGDPDTGAAMPGARWF